MSPLFFDACWLIGGTLAALVLHKGFHAGWWTLKKQPAVRVTPIDDARIHRLIRGGRHGL